MSEQIHEDSPAQVSRCEERILLLEHGKSLSPVEKRDAGVKAEIADILWKDDILRALDYHEIDVHFKNGVVTLNGHISSSNSQKRIENALHAISGIVEIKNNLVSDDKLTLDVAAALGDLEHTYGCKFFTGASHGVVSVNGTVKSNNVRLLAEKCISDNPSTRGVINNIQIPGNEQMVQDQPFLQPAIGQTIYFLDWVPGVVHQVIINPSNRRVIAMIVRGKLTSQQDELNSMNDGSTLPPERLVVIPMNTVRHLTKTSGFLQINGNERSRYMDFFPASLITPSKDWVPPYPYCPEDVLFPVEYKENNVQIEYKPDQYSFATLSKHTRLGDQLLANDSLGG
ncbi:MAG: BON domain-containing protein [Anaerolineales bacterium]|nr:BON domain-containing protein [Anaerolineales bacterium]